MMETHNCFLRENQYLDKMPTLDAKFEHRVEILKKAAETNLSEIDKAQKQPYISENNWNLIKQRDEARKRGQHEFEQTLNKIIKKEAKKNKQQFKINKLQKGISVKENGKALKKKNNNSSRSSIN